MFSGRKTSITPVWHAGWKASLCSRGTGGRTTSRQQCCDASPRLRASALRKHASLAVRTVRRARVVKRRRTQRRMTHRRIDGGGTHGDFPSQRQVRSWRRPMQAGCAGRDTPGRAHATVEAGTGGTPPNGRARALRLPSRSIDIFPCRPVAPYGSPLLGVAFVSGRPWWGSPFLGEGVAFVRGRLCAQLLRGVPEGVP